MPPLSSSKREAVAALKRGEAVIFPTETVYGLGVSVEAAATKALYDLKGATAASPSPGSWAASTTSTATGARARPGPTSGTSVLAGTSYAHRGSERRRARGLPLGSGLHRPACPTTYGP
ncbi:MAG: Sua5/YciO/YrdC/YwlC family protein [Eggerthella lenta]